MEIRSLSEFKNGWFIGNFQPSMQNSLDFEIAIKNFVKGDSEPLHFQLIATEYTVVIFGEIEINGVVFTKDSIIRIDPGENANFLARSNTAVLCIKMPSLPNDKVLI